MKKEKRNRQRTQDNNDGSKKMARMKAELQRNPTNTITSQRLAEMKKQHPNVKI